jgi:hypothetical protein
VLSNCLAFFERRAALGLDRPFIRAKMLGAPELAGEFARFAEYWGPIADEVQVQPLHNFAGGLGAVRETEAKARHACEFPFFSTAVNWDGGVPLCHRDCFGEDILGDVSAASIREVYTARATAPTAWPWPRAARTSCPCGAGATTGATALGCGRPCWAALRGEGLAMRTMAIIQARTAPRACPARSWPTSAAGRFCPACWNAWPPAPA